MKTLKRSLVLLLIISILASLASCYIISAQKMDNVKGTYKLENYSYTPSYERRSGYTPTTYNYVTDEKYMYEDYLIVTGGPVGYYVHKDASGEAYVKAINLTYQFSQEDSSKVEYVTYNDALTSSQTNGINKLGVTNNALSYSKSAFDYTELFTKREMRTESISIRWEKVDRAIDVSYAQSQIGTLKSYSYEAFGVKGIYELHPALRISTGETLESDYQYYFYVIDTADGLTTATAYYATKDAPTEQQSETFILTRAADGWNSFTLGDLVWSIEPVFSNYYTSEYDDLSRTISRISSDISASSLEWLVSNRLPIE